MLFLFLLLLLTIAYILYKYLTAYFNYWEDRNVVYEKPELCNYFKTIFARESLSERLRKLYKQYPEEKLIGLFETRSPTVIVKDLDCIKHVLVKDFNHFVNRTGSDSYGKGPLTDNLFRMTNVKWRVMRKKLTPAFSSGKMKMMFPLMLEKGEEFQKYIGELISDNNVLEIKELFSRLTTDNIGSIAFGIETGSMSNENSEFRRMGKKMTQMTLRKQIRILIRLMCPKVFEFFNMELQPDDVIDFFVKTVKDVVKHRENTHYERNDFMNLLIKLKHENKLAIDEDEMMEFDEIAMTAEAFVFFVAGFETSSILMSCALHELALQPQIMEKLVNEIDTVLKKHGELTYDAIYEMIYLEMVINETLRKYPAGNTLSRVCTQKYTFPDSNVTIDKGVQTRIPVLEIHYDPKFYPEPEKFIPERFSPEEKSRRHPMTFLSFGEGPRNCIGLRFGRLQSMVGIVSVLRKFKVEKCDKTEKVMKIDMKALITSLAHESWLKLTPRTNNNKQL